MGKLVDDYSIQPSVIVVFQIPRESSSNCSISKFQVYEIKLIVRRYQHSGLVPSTKADPLRFPF